MRAATGIARAGTAPGALKRPPTALARGSAPGLARRAAARLAGEWVPRAAWTIGRTGRPGLVGIALLLTAALFLFSTHLRVAAEVEALRAEVLAARGQVRTASGDEAVEPGGAMRALPARSEVPAILRELFNRATRARLAVDNARYEVEAARGSGIVRYHLAFPVAGPYPQIRAFIDATLAAMPAVAIDGLLIERRSIADGSVEAQIRMTIFTRSAP